MCLMNIIPVPVNTILEPALIYALHCMHNIKSILASAEFFPEFEHVLCAILNGSVFS